MSDTSDLSRIYPYRIIRGVEIDSRLRFVVREARDALGLSQKALGGYAEVDKETVNRLEKGDGTLKGVTVNKILAAFSKIDGGNEALEKAGRTYGTFHPALDSKEESPTMPDTQSGVAEDPMSDEQRRRHWMALFDLLSTDEQTSLLKTLKGRVRRRLRPEAEPEKRQNPGGNG